MLSIADAAARLSVKESEIVDAGEKHGQPWAKARSGIEYLWVDDVLHVLWKPPTRVEREEGKETSYAGLAIPRWIPPEEEDDARQEGAEGEGSEPDGDGETPVEPGSAGDEAASDEEAYAHQERAEDLDLDSCTKDQLIEHAVGLGLSAEFSTLKKADIRALIDEASATSDPEGADDASDDD